MRENHFSLDDELRNVYFKFGMAVGINTPHNENDAATVSKTGLAFLQEVYKQNNGIFIFAYVLLKKHQSSIGFADNFFKIIKNDSMSILYVQEGSKLELNEPYIIEIDKSKKLKNIYNKIFNKNM